MKKILIVDDQDDARKMLSIALRRPTHKIVEAANGLAALKAVKDHRPIVVLLDIVMPGSLNGFQVCEWIKADVELKNTFVVLLSGLNDKKDFDEARRVGANAYMVKPFRLSRLIQIVIDHAKLADTFVLEMAA
jgi:CheY-like chemotaxis protein